ncbi:MAG TPA: isochorismatase family protein [Acidimicrobiales bacterium]|jgi:nicotinamidase-related amidase|nr:isochorismatase family protein [Acidimicrobiales bacterium]
MTFVDANPYPWPWDGDLSPARLALVVAGAQRYWTSRTVDPQAALARVDALAGAARRLAVPVVWIRHGRVATSRNSIPESGTGEWDLAARPYATDLVVDAAGHDGCFGGSLEAVLRSARRDRVLMCGLGLEGPVHSTLRALNDRGFECLTVSDACAPHDSTSAAAALSTITLSFGIFGAIAPVASVLEALPTEVFAP